MEIKSLQERRRTEKSKNREKPQALGSRLGDEIPSTSQLILGYKRTLIFFPRGDSDSSLKRGKVNGIGG